MLLKATPGLWQFVAVSCVSECLWDRSPASLLVEPANGKVAAASLNLMRDLTASGNGLHQSGRNSPGLGMLEETVPLLTPLNRISFQKCMFLMPEYKESL